MEIPSDKTHKPILILVSGAPGSGKTTFASKLANQMSLLHIERDRFFQSIAYTHCARNIDREHVGIPRFYQTVEDLLSAEVSLVIDGTLYKGKSESELRRLQNFATVVNLHCRTADVDERFYAREIAKAGRVPEWLEGHMLHLAKIRSLVEDPLELDWKIIEVDTTADYNPSISEVSKALSKFRHHEGSSSRPVS
jgi:broad-specificity NMP kinase